MTSSIIIQNNGMPTVFVDNLSRLVPDVIFDVDDSYPSDAYSARLVDLDDHRLLEGYMHLCCSNLRVPTAIVYSEESFTPFLYAIINKYGNVVFSKKDEVPIWVMMIQHLISDPSLRLSPATDDAFLEQRLHPYTRFDLSELRTREMGVLVGMAMDLTTEQISVKLACSTNTVYSYRYNLKQKLGLATKFELAEFLSEIGLNPPRSELHLPLDNK